MYVRLLIQRYVCQIQTLRDGDLGDDWTVGVVLEGLRRGTLLGITSAWVRREREILGFWEWYIYYEINRDGVFFFSIEILVGLN